MSQHTTGFPESRKVGKIAKITKEFESQGSMFNKEGNEIGRCPRCHKDYPIGRGGNFQYSPNLKRDVCWKCAEAEENQHRQKQ